MVTISNIVNGLMNDYYNSVSTASKATTSTTDSTTDKTKSTTDKVPKDYSGTLVGKYLESTTPEKANAKEIFQKLSVDVGSDGKSITKDQLDSFISDAKSGKVVISDKEMASLQTLQKNFTQIADGGDKITYEGVSKAGFKGNLTAMVPDEAETTDYAQNFIDSTANAYGKVVKAALSGIENSDKSSSLSSMLNTLLSGTTDENDDSNANMIATLTNLIANSKSNSTTELEA